jgi:hypothetical protein
MEALSPRLRCSETAGHSARLRAEMVEALQSVDAARDAAVLEAMGRVPRETFVPHFFSMPGSLKTGTPADVREWHIDDDGGDEPTLNLVYNILGTNDNGALNLTGNLSGHILVVVEQPAMGGLAS